MLKWEEVPLTEDTMLFTDKEFLVFDGYTPIMSLGLTQYTMLTQQYYIWIRPTRHLEAKHLRPMKLMMSQFDGCTLFANVAIKDTVSARFAGALGFKPLATASDYIYYERTV